MGSHAESQRRWRANNREKHRELQRAHRRRKYEEIVLPAKAQPCADCGGLFSPEQMHFDHVRGPKLFNIAHGPRYSREKLKAEIAKCDVRCVSCHGRRSNRQRWDAELEQVA